MRSAMERAHAARADRTASSGIPSGTASLPLARTTPPLTGTMPRDRSNRMNVAVMGAGYVGLTTAACLAHLGHDVTCADIDADRIARLRKGEVHILEEGLPELVDEGLTSERLRFVVGASTRGARRRVHLLVRADAARRGRRRRHVIRRSRRREIAPVLRPGTVVINKSTVPVGSTRLVQRVLRSRARPPTASRRVEPRVPARGHAGPRLPQPEPHRRRLRRPRDRRARQRALPDRATHRCSSPIPRRPR